MMLHEQMVALRSYRAILLPRSSRSIDGKRRPGDHHEHLKPGQTGTYHGVENTASVISSSVGMIGLSITY